MIIRLDNNFEFNINDETALNITKEIVDVSSVGTRSTEWSKPIDIPGTKEINEYFEHIWNVNMKQHSFNKNKRVQVTISDGINTIFQGNMQLLNIIINRLNVIVYQVRLAGVLRDLIKETESISLNQLDLSEYNHVRNLETVKNSWKDTIQKNGQWFISKEGYTYPEIVYREQTNTNERYLYDYFPATYVHTVLSRILDMTGFTIKSKFFNSDKFKSLIIPFSNDKIEIKEEDKPLLEVTRGFDNTINAATTIRQERSFPTWYYNSALASAYNLSYLNLNLLNDITSNVNSTSGDLQFNDLSGLIQNDIYTCNENGDYRIDINLLMYPRWSVTASVNSIQYKNSGAAHYRWMVYLQRIDGTIELLNRNLEPDESNTWHISDLMPSSDSTVTQLPWDDINNNITIQFTGNRYLNAGDKIYVRLGFRHGSTNWEVVGGSQNDVTCQLRLARNIGQNYTYFKVERATVESFGNEDINLSNTLPNMSASDFILNLIRKFNLVVVQDKESSDDRPILIMEPYDDYYSSGRIIDDWKVDEKTIKYIMNNNIYRYEYLYQDDTDFMNKDYKEKYNARFGDFVIDSDNDFGTKVDKIQLVFAPTINALLNDKVVPYLCDYKDLVYRPIKTKTRLVYNKQIDCGQFQFKETPYTPTYSTESSYRYCGMWDDPYKPLSTLEFNESNEYYYPINTEAITLTNLFNTYHQSRIRNMINKDYRIMEAYFWLTPVQMAEFQYNDVILVNEQYWRVIRIQDYNYNNTKSLTKVVLELLTRFDTVSIGRNRALSSCPSDIIAIKSKLGIIFQSASGQEISKDCCLSKGGTYNEITKSCTIPMNVSKPGPIVVNPNPIGGGGIVLPGTVKPIRFRDVLKLLDNTPYNPNIVITTPINNIGIINESFSNITSTKVADLTYTSINSNGFIKGNDNPDVTPKL